jgi:LacI family transcriptional regulator
VIDIKKGSSILLFHYLINKVKKMTITSKEIARICGVSRGTVDRALNNRPGVNEKTRTRILSKAEELGYQPNYIGRSLVKGRSMSIGVILFDLNNRVFTQIINGIEAKAREHNYFVNLSISFRDAALERDIIRQHVARNVDGIILLSVNQGDTFRQMIQSLNKPIVTVGNRISDNTPYIWIDDRQAIKDMVSFVVNRGYEHIIYLSPPLSRIGKENLYGPEQRLKGFKESMERFSLSHQTILHSNYAEEILKSYRTKKTAVICSSDVYAIDVINICKDNGIRIPEEIGITGFDNIDILNYITPRITTIDLHSEKLGAEAVLSLLNQMNGVAAPNIQLLNYSIVSGQTL